MAPTFHSIAQLLSLRVIDSLVEGTLICMFAALLFRLAGRKNAGSRFSFWFSTLLAIATVPMIQAGSWFHVSINGSSHSAVTLPESFAVYVLGAWALISTWHLFGIGRGLWLIYQLRKNCILLDVSTLDSFLRETLTRYRANRRATLYTSDDVRVPIAIGLVKPAIVFPQWALQELSSSELNQILLHELEHLRRRDNWTNLAQKLVKAVFFFHPAVWWIERKLALEREMACDDAVIAETLSPRAYAECLAHLAEKSFLLRSLELAHSALGRIRQISARIARILDRNRAAQDPGNWRPAVVLVGMFAVGCAFLSSRAPKLVAFEKPASHLASTAREQTPALPVGDLNKPSTIVDARSAPVLQRSVGMRRPQPRNQSPLPAVTRASPQPREVGDMIRMVRATSTDVPIVERYYIVYESPEGDTEVQQVYQIRMLRLTVFQTVVGHSAHQIPRQET